MQRRTFLTIASAGIFVPKYEKWFRLFREPKVNPFATNSKDYFKIEDDKLDALSYWMSNMIVKDGNGNWISITRGRCTNQLGIPVKLVRSSGGVWVPDLC